jgi:hypothetical protein
VLSRSLSQKERDGAKKKKCQKGKAPSVKEKKHIFPLFIPFFVA